MKCQYCSAESITIRNEESLCRKHYYTFYSEQPEENQLKKVYQIKEEISLKEKYTKFMNTYDFFNSSTRNQNILKKTLKNFNRDIARINIKNKLYNIQA